MLALASCEHLPIPDNSIDLVFTDPPYSSKYLVCYEWLAKESMRILKKGGFVITMCGGYNLNKIFTTFENSGLVYFFEFIHKTSGDAPYIWPRFVVAKTKSLLCYSKGTASPHSKSVLSIFEPSAKSKQWHAWGQDVESARYYIDCFSAPNDLVLDPFIGGGTTMVASKLIGRKCIGFDIDVIALSTTRERISGIPVQSLLFQKLQERT